MSIIEPRFTLQFEATFSYHRKLALMHHYAH